jgi:hypothetical protein
MPTVPHSFADQALRFGGVRAGSLGAVVASPSTYLWNMQNAAAIKTVSWIFTSVAPVVGDLPAGDRVAAFG